MVRMTPMITLRSALASRAVRTVRIGPLLGLAGQTVVLAVLGVTAGIGLDGWLAGLAYGLVVCVALSRGLGRAGAGRLRPADRVTVARAALVGGVTALTVHAFVGHVPVALLVSLAVVALVLDGVDGAVARRTGTQTDLGARFDMEVDAFLILVLSVAVARTLGWWVLAIGAMRYAYVAAGWLLPWLRGGVPPRYWRKVVAATEGIVLTAALSGLFPTWLSATAVAIALALLVESFGRDVVWLWLNVRKGTLHKPGR